jgi:hypothetical protein
MNDFGMINLEIYKASKIGTISSKNVSGISQTRLILLTMMPCYCVSLLIMTAIALLGSQPEVRIELIHLNE